MNKYKVGDRVLIKTDDHSRLSDFESDMRQDLADRTLSGTAYDRIWKAINSKAAWKIILVDDDAYELQLENSKTQFGYQLHDEDLEAAP